MSKSKSPLSTTSFELSIEIINLCKRLNDNEKEFILSKQLLRSGTSVGANIREAQFAESKKDFIHKLGISQKECVETEYWLELLKDTDCLREREYEITSNLCLQVYKMLSSSIITARKNIKN